MSLRDLTLKSWYTSGRSDLVADFYVPCLDSAQRYDRAVGFFRSSLYALAAVALAGFVENGGKMRLVCSPRLDQDDLAAIEKGLDAREGIETSLLRDIRSIIREPHGDLGVEMLATLIANEVLQLKIAYRPSSSGIFHSKVGVFEDAEHSKVGFNGSANETGAAMLQEVNHESFSVFTSWANEVDRERADELDNYFESLWTSREPNLEVRDLPDVPREEILAHVSRDGIDGMLSRARNTLSRFIRRVGSKPPRKQLMAHQSVVVANWEQAGFRGIIKHATGSGKTITALEAIRRWIRGGRSALVLVPSDLLSIQWKNEIQQELGDIDASILYVGGSNSTPSWQTLLPDFSRDDGELGPRLTIATMQSASTDRFLSNVVAGNHLLVVADEVHRIGSSRHLRIFDIDAGGRLGLSATPERFGDPDGTRKILDYFGHVLEPEFGIPEAILAGRLVPYEYHVHRVALNDTEQENWDSMTAKIRRTYAGLREDSAGRKLQTPRFRHMLIQRAAILKRASSKVDLALRLLTEEYQEGDRWLVYCDYGEQLEQVLTALGNSDFNVLEYRSDMTGARSETLKYFEHEGGVMVAIRCLDEGVDIPLVNRALILASSSNPREFVQRRGRVLRRAPGKYSASIHDTLVVPAANEADGEDRLPILRVELARASEFASYAQNRAVHHDLRAIAVEAGLLGASDPESDFEEEE